MYNVNKKEITKIERYIESLPTNELRIFYDILTDIDDMTKKSSILMVLLLILDKVRAVQ